MPGRRACLAALAALLTATPGLGAASPAAADTVSASVSSTPFAPALASGFIGTSMEFRAVRQYTGPDPHAVDPVMLALIRNLVPGQAPVLRIGGDSTDGTWWPVRGMKPPGGISYSLTDGWLRTTRALAAALRAKLILGINLAAGRPAIAAAEGDALQRGIGRRYIDALEIGNEPDLYGVFPFYQDRHGHPHRARGRHYGLTDYTREFTRWSRVLPRLPLAGPVTSGPGWMSHLGRFISAEHGLRVVTYHRYPLRACSAASSPSYPTIPALLDDSSSVGLAAGVLPYVRVAHADHLPFRLTELNSASCEGTAGVSDTFAAALWALDTLFNMASVGVDGVNFHMLPGAHYELFSTSRSAAGQWQADVHPEYYGLLMFAQAFPPGARLLKVSAPGGPVKVWATQDAAGTLRVTLINKDPANAHDVQLQVPGSPGPSSLETLQAPSVSSTSGATLGGQSFGPETTTGTLPGPPQSTPIQPLLGTYTVQLPAGSAALLTVSGSGGGSALLRHR